MNRSDIDDAVTLDPQNPWLGLFSYTEATRAYFHGRDEESAELARRVQRKILTVLFGQSGLGKTSLLRAGLVPRVRPEGYCPVYVRVDYAPESPPPAEQIKQAIFRATAESAAWTRPGAAIQGESLWEFLHHRGDLLRGADGRPLIPLLIFDQFEEVFTLGQADDDGRRRAARFLQELADLVENRPPEALEQRLDADDTVAEDFDFARADYRVLIALREDYLAHLESVKGIMPSITQNRMRLARMTGAQALSAVIEPGGRLVSQEVAESIVRFVAGGSELANAEIEPSLLSLVCRELNNARIAQGRGEISADLLAGSRNTILSEFYERAMADQPPGVRRIVEDELLTESGYRESLAEERVRKALEEAGAAPDALATLVNRRLLRIEERLDMRRVELTHDVLCGVVLASRNLRHEREARDAAQRQLAEQQAREAAAYRAMVRARMVAGVSAVLMLVAVAGAIFGWVNFRRARTAEAEAQTSRTHAETLVSFLIEDFYNELAPTGRLGTLGKLAKKTVAYYDSLPAAMVTARTRINRAMALIREGQALSANGQIAEGGKRFAEAERVFEQLHKEGHHGEDIVYGLALALSRPSGGGTTGNNAPPAALRRAADLLRPWTGGGQGTRRDKLLYARILTWLSLSQTPAQGLKSLQQASGLLAPLGALDLSDLDATTAYAETAYDEALSLSKLGRLSEAQKRATQVDELTAKVLARRPGDLPALHRRFAAADMLAQLARQRYDFSASLPYARQAEQRGQQLIRFDPSNFVSWGDWARGVDSVATALAEQGHFTQAIAAYRPLLTLRLDQRNGALTAQPLANILPGLAFLQAGTGDAAAADQTLKKYASAWNVLVSETYRLSGPAARMFGQFPKMLHARVQVLAGHPRRALAIDNDVIAVLDAIRLPPHPAYFWVPEFKKMLSKNVSCNAARANLELGNYGNAEALAGRCVAIQLPSMFFDYTTADRQNDAVALHAQALAAQGRRAEARKTLQPALDYFRAQRKSGAGGVTFRRYFAHALYVDALASNRDAAGRARRRADLAEAAKLIDQAPGEARNTVPMRRLSGLIAKARRAHA